MAEDAQPFKKSRGVNYFVVRIRYYSASLGNALTVSANSIRISVNLQLTVVMRVYLRVRGRNSNALYGGLAIKLINTTLSSAVKAHPFLAAKSRFSRSRPVQVVPATLTNFRTPNMTLTKLRNQSLARLAPVFLAMATVLTQANAVELGVNIHYGGTAEFNTQRATVMKQRNIKSARMDFISFYDPTALRDQVQKIRANGGSVQVVLWTQFGNDHSCNPNLASVESSAYNDAFQAVNKVKDLIHDFELLNETQNRAEITQEVPINSAGLSDAPYAGKPCVASLAAGLRGMSRAIRDIRASSGLPLRSILGLSNRDFGFLTFMQNNGVLFDVVGFHAYQTFANTSLLTDSWWGPGGPYVQLAKFGKPVHFNEFNCGETYRADYENQADQPVTESCLKAINKHLKDMINQTSVKIESAHIYELLDAPEKAGPEGKFGLMYDMSRNKPHMYLYTAFTGGNLTAQERYEITRRSLMTDAEIDSRRSSQVPVSVPAPAPAPVPVPVPAPVPAPAPDAQAPVVSITNPVNGSVLRRRSTINVTATAIDNVGISEVRMSLNGALICASTSPPFQCQMRLSASRNWTGKVDVQAFDMAGNIGSKSITVSTQ